MLFFFRILSTSLTTTDFCQYSILSYPILSYPQIRKDRAYFPHLLILTNTVFRQYLFHRFAKIVLISFVFSVYVPVNEGNVVKK